MKIFKMRTWVSSAVAFLVCSELWSDLCYSNSDMLSKLWADQMKGREESVNYIFVDQSQQDAILCVLAGLPHQFYVVLEETEGSSFSLRDHVTLFSCLSRQPRQAPSTQSMNCQMIGLNLSRISLLHWRNCAVEGITVNQLWGLRPQNQNVTVYRI